MTTTTVNNPDVLRGTWAIDPTHSSFEFQARHAMIATVRGHFNEFSGTLHLDPDNPTNSSGRVELEAGSIDTRQPDRDAHLKSADFLDAENHPKLVFESTRAEAGDDQDSYKLWGNLTIRGISKEVELDLTFNGVAVDPFGNQRAGFEATAVINRKDWNLLWNAPLEAGGVLIGDKIKLALDISAIKQG
jgi:polyisoprenoid-binding protein YceI